MQAQAPVAEHCRSCGGERRFRFAGYATPDAHENTVRPRALYRTCAECARVALVLGWPIRGYVYDGEALIDTVLDEWYRSTQSGDSTSIDHDELRGMLVETLWRRYLRWLPGGISFTSDATFVLRKRIRSWSRDQLGGIQRRNGRGGLYTVQPKAHSPAVSVSFDEILERNDGLVSDVEQLEERRLGVPFYDVETVGTLGRGLGEALARVTAYDPRDRDSDLGWLLGF